MIYASQPTIVDYGGGIIDVFFGVDEANDDADS